MSCNSIVPSFSKDFGKKKRTNKSAKLKQCKMDARREQWLSQVKCKGCKEESNEGAGSPPLSSASSLLKFDMKLIESEDKAYEHDNESDSTVADEDPLKDCNSTGYYSGSVTEEDECADDWETVADALAADTYIVTETPSVQENEVAFVYAAPELPKTVSEVGIPKPECNGKVVVKNHAWRADDVCRPQSLPNLSKSYTAFPMNAEGRCGHGAGPWAYNTVVSQPMSCLICYEDLDLTESRFLPCLCGFRVCLFCHKRILEEADSRCPGCRKMYDVVNGEKGMNGGASTFHLARSVTMATRS